MTDERLFPPDKTESLAWLRRFVREEMGKREAMLKRHPDKADYWHDRVQECRQALKHLGRLEGK